MSSRTAWRLAAAATAAVLVLLALRGLDTRVGNGDEAIYAENIREMKRSGDFGVLTYQDEPGLLRPALPFVPIAIVSEWIDGEPGLRLVQALWFLLILGLVFITAHRGWGRLDLAILATVLCAGVPTFFLFARSLFSDPALVAATTFALYATVRAQDEPRWLIGVAAGLGAGVAVKSLAAAVPGVALAPWLVVAVVRHRPWRTLALALALFLALAAPYFVYSYLRFGDRFLDEHLGLSIGTRIGGGSRVGMGGGVAAYALHVFHNDGPAAAGWMVTAVLGGGALAWRHRDPALAIAVTYAAGVFVLMSLVGTRLEHYLLPMYPALALAAAGSLHHIGPRITALRPHLRAGLVAAAAVTLFLLGAASPIDEKLLPAPQVVALGAAAEQATPPGEPVYSLDWYAPALGYYADRDWHLLSTSPQVTEHLAGIYLFRLAGNIHGVPPWPPPPFTIAGHRADLEAVGLLGRGTVLAEVGDWLTIRIAR